MDEEEEGRNAPSKPQFAVRARGVDGFVGSGWMQEGRFGRYISVRLGQPLGKDAVLYLHPRRDSPGVLG